MNRGSGQKQQVIGMMFGFLPNDLPIGRPGPDPALQKKVTGTTLRFLPSYPERRRNRFGPQPAQMGSRPKQQVIGMMFGFLPNDLFPRPLILAPALKKR